MLLGLRRQRLRGVGRPMRVASGDGACCLPAGLGIVRCCARLAASFSRLLCASFSFSARVRNGVSAFLRLQGVSCLRAAKMKQSQGSWRARASSRCSLAEST